MEALLPSEIARLVLGYLKDQKCPEAAKVFLETSPHLHECRTVISNGRRFSTRVSGMSLIDILEKFTAVNAIIQERLSKLADNDHLKHYSDLLEQLKFLIEETRGQRFVVNINVPSQTTPQVSNGSPIISSSTRKRRHSNSDRERCKRVKSCTSTIIPQQSELTSNQGCDTTEANLSENVLEHNEILKQLEQNPDVLEARRRSTLQEESHGDSTFVTSKTMETKRMIEVLDDVARIDIGNRQNPLHNGTSLTENDNSKDDNRRKRCNLEKCTTSTSTEELLSFSCAEVQTLPCDTPDSESESNDEPIENLSLLTKELLNRTELQERIAENINKAILPVDISMRDESLNQSLGGEMNTSIMSELNNAIKSIVEATESDPVFEKFLDEIIGPNTETDTSPDEDADGKSTLNCPNEPREQLEITLNNVGSPEPSIVESRLASAGDVRDIPLKHRLRSSSRQQNTKSEDDTDKREPEKEQNALEDQNAAAVLSIINASITNNKSFGEKRGTEYTRESIIMNDEVGKKSPISSLIADKAGQALKAVSTIAPQTNVVVTIPSNEIEPKTRKSTVKRPRPTKLKRETDHNTNELISEQEIMAMPTLIVCSKDEINSFLTVNPAYPSVRPITSTSTSHFIPIAPKDPNRMNEPMETVYLRTVNVAQKIPAPTLVPATEESKRCKKSLSLQSSQRKSQRADKKSKTAERNAAQIQSIDHAVPSKLQLLDIDKPVAVESITLYNNDNSARTLLDTTSLPMINIEDNVSLSGTGLSPYLKFNSTKINEAHDLSDIDLTVSTETAKNSAIPNVPAVPASIGTSINDAPQPSTSKNTACDVITKRTPRSLLRSRSKNHRLSLSTPRRHSGHIRALDFNTPIKSASSVREANDTEGLQFSPRSRKHIKSVCKTSLFKSPPFSSTSTLTQKMKTPLKLSRPCKVPIATRSPAPKLMGGWEKYNGVGMIIGDVSPHGTSCGSRSEEDVESKVSRVAVDSWDADLRKGIQVALQDECQKAQVTNARKKGVTKKLKKDKCNLRIARNKNGRKIAEGDSLDGVGKENSDNGMRLNLEKNHELQNNSDVLNAHPETKNSMAEGNVPPNNLTESPSTHPNLESRNNGDVVEKKSIKKYVQLRTICTKLNKNDTRTVKRDFVPIANVTSGVQGVECTKLSTENSQQILQMPDMMHLETPRKFENISGIPPTPRLLSPSSNIITPFIKISEDSSRMRSFISTPEFPTTPCIALTPKLTEENTRDEVKKGTCNSCSTYYRPSSEQNASVEKPIKSQRGNELSKLSGVSLINEKLSVPDPAFQKCMSAKLEITQFEVIKENLPREEAVKELKISSNSKDLITERSINDEFTDASKCTILDREKYLFNSEEDSSDSDTSSSSSNTSSSSSSSTASSSSNASNQSVSYSVSKKSKRLPNKIYTDTSNDSGQKAVHTQKIKSRSASPIAAIQTIVTSVSSMKSEVSPLKVFSITKTDDELKHTVKETPAKDETLLNEADISETPSSSKKGVENVTNLSSKISAFESCESETLSMTLEEPIKELMKACMQKTKMINMQGLEQNTRLPPKFTKDGDCANSLQSEQRNLGVEEKLIIQLEKKRQRMIAKFKEGPKSSNTRIQTQYKQSVLKLKNNSCKIKVNKHRAVVQKKGIPKRSNISRNPKFIKESNTKTKGYVTDKPDENLQKITGVTTNKMQAIKVHAQSKNADDYLTALNNLDLNSKHEKNVTNYDKEDIERADDKDSTSMACITLVQGENEQKPEKQNFHTDNARLDVKQSNETSVMAYNVAREDLNNSLLLKPEKQRVDDRNVYEPQVGALTEANMVYDNLKEGTYDHIAEEMSKTRDHAGHAAKTKSIPKSKVDQVKRDLFSDEESDQRALQQKENSEIRAGDKEISPCMVKVLHSENISESIKAEDTKVLSSVLQCLQLVPTSKTDHAEEERSEDGNELNTTNPNSVEYHFVYDENAATKKRRHRYSTHELAFQAKVELSDQNYKECIKFMKATDFEEIFNVTPSSKKRLVQKKATGKNDKCLELHNLGTCHGTLTLKNNHVKPLATSSPVERTSVYKIRKILPKNNVVEKKVDDTQKKKIQMADKTQVAEEEIVASKVSRKKMPDLRATKKFEKKQLTTNPQVLLSNLDLDEFLTSVHGPA
ncbi:hypothetical protein KM043_003074 [Ampulex compressa]|nr:hypothetical protein KM043_003074 [Ampulex compressa]